MAPYNSFKNTNYPKRMPATVCRWHKIPEIVEQRFDDSSWANPTQEEWDYYDEIEEVDDFGIPKRYYKAYVNVIVSFNTLRFDPTSFDDLLEDNGCIKRGVTDLVTLGAVIHMTYGHVCCPFCVKRLDGVQVSAYRNKKPEGGSYGARIVVDYVTDPGCDPRYRIFINDRDGSLLAEYSDLEDTIYYQRNDHLRWVLHYIEAEGLWDVPIDEEHQVILRKLTAITLLCGTFSYRSNTALLQHFSSCHPDRFVQTEVRTSYCFLLNECGFNEGLVLDILADVNAMGHPTKSDRQFWGLEQRTVSLEGLINNRRNRVKQYLRGCDIPYANTALALFCFESFCTDGGLDLIRTKGVQNRTARKRVMDAFKEVYAKSIERGFGADRSLDEAAVRWVLQFRPPYELRSPMRRVFDQTVSARKFPKETIAMLFDGNGDLRGEAEYRRMEAWLAAERDIINYKRYEEGKYRTDLNNEPKPARKRITTSTPSSKAATKKPGTWKATAKKATSTESTAAKEPAGGKTPTESAARNGSGGSDSLTKDVWQRFVTAAERIADALERIADGKGQQEVGNRRK